MSENVITPTARVTFPFLNNPDDKGYYRVDLLFEKDSDLADLKRIAQAALVKKWGHDQTQWPQDLISPFKDQGAKFVKGTKNLYPGYAAGCKLIAPKSKYKPLLVRQDKSPVADPAEIYSGCYARAAVEADTYDYLGKRGVRFWLKGIQLVRNGEPLGGGGITADVFSPLEGAVAPAPATASGGLFD